MNQDKNFLEAEPVGKLLLKLALPTVAAQVINMLYNIVDRIYIGHIADVGSLALTGVGVCMPLIMIVTAFSAFAGYGGAPRASIFMGKGDHASAEKTLGNCFVLQIFLSVLLTGVLLLWNRDLLLAFGASENTIPFAVDYMNIYALGTVFVQLTLGMNAFITAQGFAKTGMLSVLIGAAANIILDPIFIFGLDMGVRGAALATVLSQTASCIWVLLFLFGRKTSLRIRKIYMRPRMEIILPVLALGSSVFIMQASESIISVCFNSSLLRYGGDIAVGAMTILTSVMQFAMLPLQGLGQGAQPIISYNYGAGNSARVKSAYWLLLRADLCRMPPFVRYSNGMPNDFYFYRLRQSLYYRSSNKKIHSADSPDLHTARYSANQQNNGGLHSRACCRFSCSYVYIHFVCFPVQKSYESAFRRTQSGRKINITESMWIIYAYNI